MQKCSAGRKADNHVLLLTEPYLYVTIRKSVICSQIIKDFLTHYQPEKQPSVFEVKGMIKIRNVCKSCTLGGGEVKALDNVCFDLPDKGMFFVLGKSGSGKSTLLNVLGGLDKADSGSVVIDGNDILKFGEKELDGYRNGYCGFVFQEFNLLPMLDVGENVRLGLSIQGKKDTELRVKEALAAVELSGYEGRNITELSGVQKQRKQRVSSITKKRRIWYPSLYIYKYNVVYLALFLITSISSATLFAITSSGKVKPNLSSTAMSNSTLSKESNPRSSKVVCSVRVISLPIFSLTISLKLFM